MNKIVIINVSEAPAGILAVNCIFYWEITDQSKRLPLPGWASRFAGISPEDLGKIRSGELIEEPRGFHVPATYTLNQIAGFLEDSYNSRLAAVTAADSPGEYYGKIWDGTTWS